MNSDERWQASRERLRRKLADLTDEPVPPMSPAEWAEFMDECMPWQPEIRRLSVELSRVQAANDEQAAEIERLRGHLRKRREIPVGHAREALYRHAESHRRSKPWRRVWWLLKLLEDQEAANDAVRAATAEWLELAKAATPGEWRHSPLGIWLKGSTFRLVQDDGISAENGAFIAASRSVADSLASILSGAAVQPEEPQADFATRLARESLKAAAAKFGPVQPEGDKP